MRFVRPHIARLHPYVPGEQPRIAGLIKLNTNENPYGPSPKVLRAIEDATGENLRLYPNPTSQRLREKLAKFHGCRAENILVGNGSDELLAMATRVFVEPGKGVIQYFTPSYSLYPVLADIQDAKHNAVPLDRDFGIPANQRGKWDFNAALSLITTPNAPSGRAYSTQELFALCRRQKGVVVLDEAYVDFADNDAMDVAKRLPNVLVARTFSKAYSLCFLRVGYFVGHPTLIAALDKVRDSYNVNGLGQVAALATLDDLGYYHRNFKKVIATRERLSARLRDLGFEVFPSQTNFILVKPTGPSAKQWLEYLRRRKILVRWFNTARLRDYLRISIGSDPETNALLTAIRARR